MSSLWGIFANSVASIVFGLSSLWVLSSFGKIRDANNRIAHARITAWIVQCIFFYTLILCLFGHFILKIPISVTIHDGFGDERTAWLLFGTSIDLALRLYGLLDE